MASSDQVRYLHNATDQLFEAAGHAFVDIAPAVQMKIIRHDEPRTLFHKIVRLEGYHTRGREIHELTKLNIQTNLEQYGVVNVLSPTQFWFGLGLYGTQILHFLEAGRDALVIVPPGPLEFGPLINAARRQIEFGDAIRPEEEQSAQSQRMGCALAFLVLGSSGLSLPCIGHMAGWF